jgi:hypothetical protein
MWKLGLRPCIPKNGIQKWDFGYSTGRLRKRDNLLKGEGGRGRERERNQIIQWRERVLYNHSILPDTCTVVVFVTP